MQKFFKSLYCQTRPTTTLRDSLHMAGKQPTSHLRVQCVLYDMLILAMAIRMTQPKSNTFTSIRNSCFNASELALVAGATKFRSLVDFAYPSSISKGDDITCTTIGLSFGKLTQSLSSTRQSVNKFTAHLADTRIDRINASILKMDSLRPHALTLLTTLWGGLKSEPTTSRGTKYRNALKDELKELGITT